MLFMKGLILQGSNLMQFSKLPEEILLSHIKFGKILLTTDKLKRQIKYQMEIMED
jgi:hypothetical protein